MAIAIWRDSDQFQCICAENPGPVVRTMVGDRKHDLIGAGANDMRSIGVSYGYGSVAELAAAGAVGSASTPSKLPAIVIE